MKSIVRNTLFFCLLCFLARLAICQDEKLKKNGNEGETSDFEGVFQIKNWDGDYKKPEVKVDTSGIIREPLDADAIAQINQANPDGTIASKIKTVEKISWRPKWRYDGIGGVALPVATLSSDYSSFVVVERTGEGKGPNSSRLVIFSTYNWKILRLHEIPERKISKISFIPGTLVIVAYSERQSELKMPNELLLIDADNGEVKTAKRFKDEVSDILCLKNIVLVKTVSEKKNFLLGFDVADLSDSLTFDTINGAAALAGLPETNTFACAGENGIEVFNLDSSKTVAKFAAPEKETPSSVVFLGKPGLLAVLYKGFPCYAVSEAVTKKIVDAAELGVVYNANAKELLVEEMKSNRMIALKLPDLVETDSFTPDTVKPRTRGNIIFVSYLPHRKKYLFLNNQGYLYECAKSGRRWKKELIFEAPK